MSLTPILSCSSTAIILFMETANYTALVISRVLQCVGLTTFANESAATLPDSPLLPPHICRGISGTGIWTLGLALVTDSVPEERIGTVRCDRPLKIAVPSHELTHAVLYAGDGLRYDWFLSW